MASFETKALVGGVTLSRADMEGASGIRTL